MKKYRLLSAISLVAAFLLSACSQDELAEQGTALPDGKYPLQIGSVSISAEASEQPWTRVSESTDGQSSVWDWDGTEQIGVELNGETTTYTLNADKTLIPDKQLYWTSTAPATITAWYPTNETVDLSDQTNGLAYVLYGTGTGSYDQAVTLDFKHQLAKVRVVLDGTQASDVTEVEVNNYTQCTHTQGTVTGMQEGWITMHQVNATTYEANVVPVATIPDDFIRVNGQTATVSNITTLAQGAVHTIDLTVGKPVLEDGAELNNAGTYYMQGTYTQGITINGDNITVVLDDATLNTSGISINVQSDATIRVSGADNTINSSNGVGIFVAEGNTVTITGSSRSDKLTTSGGNGAGIGGYVNDSNSGAACGNIIIRNVTVTSYGNYNDRFLDQSAGIGGASRGACGAITIENATVYAYGTEYVTEDVVWAATPAIGSGYPNTGTPTGGIPEVTISGDSEVHAHRGGDIGNTDYIGWGGNNNIYTGANNAVNLGGGTCTNSTVYCYTGETLDKTVVYDADGNDTEQSQ
ncbi:MAG: hypothetical protein KH386_05160 [Bacteroides sp.]|nr:hypothetical protein [Bacteroides sp.]